MNNINQKLQQLYPKDQGLSHLNYYRPYRQHERLFPTEFHRMPSLQNLALVGSITPPVPPAVVGGWVELARTTLGSSNATIDVTSLADKRYLMVLCDAVGISGGANTGTQLNGVTTSTYARRGSNNGAADGTATSATNMTAGGTGTQPHFQVGYLANVSTKEKLLLSNLVAANAAGAGTAPFRNESVGKHAQTTNPISSYQWITTVAATFDTNSQVVVLGWDPADTHTDNFWEELASVNATASALDSGVFTAKKYLWIQAWLKFDTATNSLLRFGNTTLDAGNNYSNRQSLNGASDTTNTSISHMNWRGSSVNENPVFFNAFVVNVAAEEKLLTGHLSERQTAGAGTAPDREELTGKWANTSDLCDRIGFVASGGDLDTTSIMKIWGSD